MTDRKAVACGMQYVRVYQGQCGCDGICECDNKTREIAIYRKSFSALLKRRHLFLAHCKRNYAARAWSVDRSKVTELPTALARVAGSAVLRCCSYSLDRSVWARCTNLVRSLSWADGEWVEASLNSLIPFIYNDKKKLNFKTYYTYYLSNFIYLAMVSALEPLLV